MATPSSSAADDKASNIIPFVLRKLQEHVQTHGSLADAPLFCIGFNGVQGIGKTTLVSSLASTLSSPPHNFPTLVLSIDDLYKSFERLQQLKQEHPSNTLISTRGQPSTHDVDLGAQVFASLRSERETRVPSYDKSAHNGVGDRVDEANWQVVNRDGDARIKVLIFEGWCVGFRSLGQDAVRASAKKSREAYQSEPRDYVGQLAKARIGDLLFIDESLAQYAALTDQLDIFIHLDAENPVYVYDWRLEQEHALIKLRGSGMTDDQVHKFVDNYYSSYELYTDQLRQSFKSGIHGCQMRILVGRNRETLKVEIV